MKTLLILILCLPACTVITGNASTGSYAYASVGGSTSNYAQTSSGFTAGGIDNAAGFLELNKTIRGGILSGAAVDIVKTAAAAITP